MIQILLPLPLKNSFSYLAEKPLEVGQGVQVPFGNKKLFGIVWHASPSPFSGQLRVIEQILPWRFTSKHCQFLEFVAQYNLSILGLVLKQSLGSFVKEFKAFPQLCTSNSDKTINLSNAQQAVFSKINFKGFHVHLLHGVTGSGKSEVYFQAISGMLDKQVLILLPEISLSPQWEERFTKYFGFKPGIWNSSVAQGYKNKLWHHLISGNPMVVVGARSALFLPFTNLGMIIVDEEHDLSYKQENNPRYQARDMAIARAKYEDVPIILASATPSLESLAGVKEGKYLYLALTKRHADALPPKIEIVDMSAKRAQIISLPLQNALQENLFQNKQSIVFIGRRGYSLLTKCFECGYVETCPKCQTNLVYHKLNDILRCHHCSYKKHNNPICPNCQISLATIGIGAERIQQEINRMLPEARTELVTSDTITAESFRNIVHKMQNNELDILIGTQILGQGHDFSNLTLVGILNADVGLHGGDLRALERTYQLLEQVSGRAGRKQPGRAIIQTNYPNHPILQTIAHGSDNFLELERELRQQAGLPPYGRLVLIWFKSKNQLRLQKFVLGLPLNTLPKEIQVLGPIPAMVRQGKFFWKMLLKSNKEFPVQKQISKWINTLHIPSWIQIDVDIDPYSF